MKTTISRWFNRSCVTAAVLAVSSSATAQVPDSASASPTTAVMVQLTIKPEVDRAQLATIMPDEVRETVKTYLHGRIQQWFGRADRRGVIFILNAGSLTEAKAIMDALPLAKAGFTNFEFTLLTPLTPLGLLVADHSQP